MGNLDKLLKQIELNKDTGNEVTIHQLTIAGETFDVKTMTREQKMNFIFNRKTVENCTFGDIVKWAKPIIYTSLDLAPLAVKAKEAGYIKSYYDVVEALFEPIEIAEIISFICDINSFGGENVLEAVEDIKK